jgi:hypothetical protein
MAIPINKQGGRATYYYPDDGYLRRYDDFGVTQISLEAWTPARRGKGVLGWECPLGR